MIPEWAWALMGGTVVGLAGFWCRSVLISLEKIQTSVAGAEKNLAELSAKLNAVHSRVDRLEEFHDKVVERRAK